MELKNKKSAFAALATLGITAVAAGATAFVKIRQKRRRQQQDFDSGLTPDQEMVYNEAIRAFLSLNDRIYELRQLRQDLQPLIRWMATDGERPTVVTDDERISRLADDIQRFLTMQVPFINACISTINDNGTSYSDYVRAAVEGSFDPTLDEDSLGADVAEGTPVRCVLRLGYCFPNSRIAQHPVKSVVLV